MAQDIVYTLGIIISILLLLLFLRSILLRRQRAQISSLQLPATTWVHSSHNMDVVRPEAAITNPPAIFRTRTQGSESRDQLPRYEAPPPDYDVVVKNLERRDSLRQGEERGEPSRAPPGYDGQAGDAVIVINEPPAVVAPRLVQAPPRTATDRGRLFKVDVRRAWGGTGR